MSLLTGTPLGTITATDEIVLEGAPYLYFQNSSATPLSNPDANGYYWGLSGTATYPVYNLGCVTDVVLSEDITMNPVRCDNVGDLDVVQKRNYVDLTFTLQHLFPFEVLSKVANLSIPKTGLTDIEEMGIGSINNNRRYMVYLPKVYDEDVGDWVMIHLHKAKFVDAWSIAMTSGEPWKMSGIRVRAFWDSTKPAGSEFGTMLRADPSLIA